MRASLYPTQSSLRRKIVIGFIVFISIPILFFELVLFRSWLSTTRDIVIHRYETILGEAVDSMQEHISDIEKMNDYVYRDYQNDPVFFDKLRAPAMGPSLRNDPYLNAVFSQLGNRSFSQLSDNIVYSYFTMQGDLIYQRSNVKSQVQFTSMLSNYSQEPWFQQIEENGPFNTVLTAHRSLFQLEDVSLYFTFAQVIRSPIDLEPVGISMLNVNANLFLKLLKSPSDNELIKTVVTDSRGNLLFTNDTAREIPSQSPPIFHQTLEPYGWEVKGYLSSQRLTQNYIGSIIQNNGLFLIANFVLLAAIIGFLTRQLKPLYILANKMKKAKEGNFHVKVAKYSTDEIGMLCDIFNEMTSEIQQLFERQKQQYQEKLHFQMQSLETQINPHFIYNTLDLIQSRVFDAKPEEASELVVSLSIIMRYTTTRPGEKVTCLEEFKWLNDYIFLQQQLIGERVDVHIEFEDRIMLCKVHKLVLQPIIENAFIHGFEHRRSGNRLSIKGYEDEGWLIFEVEDNGQGFPEPVDLQLTRDNVEILKDWGTGMYVTAQRFLLQSDESVLFIRSQPGEGAHVTMKQILYDRNANIVG